MNVTLQSVRAVPSSVPESDILEGTIVNRETTRSGQQLELSSMESLLRHVGPLPREALLMGLAADGLPVLLNMWDPTPGPIMVAGDSGTGNTAFLQVLAGFVRLRHRPHEVQYGVITNRPHEWHGHHELPQCIGIFPMKQKVTADFIHALAVWLNITRTNRQSVLLLLDGIEHLVSWNAGLEQDFHNLILHGPSARIWPVIALDLEHHQDFQPWLKYFRTRVFGHTQFASFIDVEAASQAGCHTLSKGKEFTLKAAGQWIRFLIPDLHSFTVQDID
jgi:hypothetical protein